MEKEGWRKLIWSGGCKPELMTATESFYLILQLCKIQLSLDVKFSWGGGTKAADVLLLLCDISSVLLSCLAPFCFSACCWCCFWLEKQFGGAFLPGSWWCKALVLHMLWAFLHSSPLRNCLQPSWVCAFGLAGSWPKQWSHEEAYKVYFGNKILGEAGRRLKRILKKMVQMRSNFFIYTLCYCSGLWI